LDLRLQLKWETRMAYLIISGDYGINCITAKAEVSK
jgi:hypothetical protein